MSLPARVVRKQLLMLRPLLENSSLEKARIGQNKLGEIMAALHHRDVVVKPHPFQQFEGAWVVPGDERRQGVILYLHGGGYTCGGLEYAKGFASILAVQCGVRVFCAGYRLAPEHPFPAAVEDAVEAYRYLLKKGYFKITLCGESAGGGLCYSLCMRLKELELPLPDGIIAISPWTDLTNSSKTYETNRERDPSMSKQLLDFYAGCYTDAPENPLASPLRGDLRGMPPSLLFVGGDEILLDDTRLLHRKLQKSGCKSQLVVAPERWHVYVLYDLKENQGDFPLMNQFLNRVMSQERKLRWMRLDNAAKIYPAARRNNWSNVFRLSMTLRENVDVTVLQAALDVTVRRFPSIATRLRRGVFWYYLQQLSAAPEIQQENSYPLARMNRDEVRRCAFRVIVYHKRIAVEFFHSLTDGNGGMVFLKTLVAEYLQQKYGLRITAENGVLGRLEEPTEQELEDSFPKYAATVSASRREANAWHPHGTPEPDGFLNLVCLQLPVEAVRAKAHEYGVSITAFLAAAMMQALLRMQQEAVHNPARRKPIKVLIPVNLRNLFPSKTLRNFALYTTPEIDPRLGEYDFREICRAVTYRMGLDVTPQQMSSKIASNVKSEDAWIIKLMPLFIKNAVMKAVFNMVGEKKSCLTMSNLGAMKLPKEMEEYVDRIDFILGVQASAPNNCGIISWKDTIYINFIRNIRESALEWHFHCVLRDLGLPVLAESNLP